MKKYGVALALLTTLVLAPEIANARIRNEDRMHSEVIETQNSAELKGNILSQNEINPKKVERKNSNSILSQNFWIKIIEAVKGLFKRK